MQSISGKICAIIAIASLSASCASRDELARRIAGRWGPDPIIQPADVSAVMQQQIAVLGYIATDAGLASVEPLRTFGDPRWYYVAEWGFNIGRQDCAAYLDNLFRIQREKLRNHDVINALQLATAGIVTATAPHSAKALSVVAAAFGLGTSLNDAILQSYLFTEAPGLISLKVKQMQDDYQSKVTSASVTTAAQAYSALQNYYNICLPQSIEGVILDKVAKSDVTDAAAGKPNAGTGAPKLNLTPRPANTLLRTPLLQ